MKSGELSGIERREHPRLQAQSLVAIVRVPESPLDFYFEVENISLTGLAIVTQTVEGFPLEVDAVIDIELFSNVGSIRCRGVIARVIPGSDGEPLGFGVRVYGFGPNEQTLWLELVKGVSGPESLPHP